MYTEPMRNLEDLAAADPLPNVDNGPSLKRVCDRQTSNQHTDAQ